MFTSKIPCPVIKNPRNVNLDAKARIDKLEECEEHKNTRRSRIIGDPQKNKIIGD